jgi:hypothetical protein
VLGLIATGSSEADYGYAKMTQVVAALKWTALYDDPTPDTNSANRGLWEECQNDTNTNPDRVWRHVETNAFLWPTAWKSAFLPSAPTIAAPCTELPDDPEECFVYTWVVLEPGCYIRSYTISEALGDSGCLNSPDDTATFHEDAGFLSGVVIASASCCGDASYMAGDPPVLVEQYDWISTAYSYTPYPCPPGEGGAYPCVPITGIDTYSYYRNAQTLTWTNNVALTNDVDIYFKASNPANPASQPDNESFFAKNLKRTYAHYATITGAGLSFEVDDFDTDEKPWASDTLEVKSWQLNGAAVLIKWGLDYD